MSDQGVQTPLLDLLRGVPPDGVHSYEHHATHHQNVPYGRLCHEAVAEAERLIAERDYWRRDCVSESARAERAEAEAAKLRELVQRALMAFRHNCVVSGSDEWCEQAEPAIRADAAQEPRYD
jgi:hypothetical protein